MKDRKIWMIAAAILINTMAIIMFLSGRAMVKEAVVYEAFSENAKAGIYKIESVEDYLEFANTVSLGNDYAKCEVILMEDLDFSGITQTPIIGHREDGAVIFLGIFNGNGHTIKGMNIVNTDGEAAMFADLAGMVLNLTLEDCRFEGNLCGGIAAELKSEGAIVNSYVEAECIGENAGAISGLSRGFLFNCVATGETFTAESKGARIESCYLKDNEQYISAADAAVVLNAAEAAAQLNQHLPRSGAFHGREDLLRWNAEEELMLGDERAILLKELTAKANNNRKETVFQAYYSHHTDHWCIALPPGYHDLPLTMVAENTKGKTQKFQRRPEEETILYTDGEYQYLIDFLKIQDADTIMIDLNSDKTLEDIYQNKRVEYPGIITKISSDGSVHSEYLEAIYGHGNDSWDAAKKSFNLKFSEETDFFGLGADEDFVLLAGYRDDSIMSYVTTTTMIQNTGFPYAHDFDLINVYIEGEYVGVYFLVEKIELDENRVNISSVYEEMRKEHGKKLETYEFQSWKDANSQAERYYYEIDRIPEDITGGYLLELDISDYDADASRYVTKRGNRMTMKRAHYSSKEQVNYVADFWQEFEDALYAESGYNALGKRYTEYIDLESFARQWLMYELVQENSMSSSVYFYKESNVTGDGLLHACYPWDMEHSYLMYGPVREMWLKDSTMSNAFWSKFWMHEDFREMVRKLWKDEFIIVIEQMIAQEPSGDNGEMKNLSWYKEHIENISAMETSRWWMVHPSNRCDTIREFLEIRIETLSVLLMEEL